LADAEASLNQSGVTGHPHGHKRLLSQRLWDGRIIFWNIVENKKLKVLDNSFSRIHALAVSHDETKLAVADESGVVFLWDIASVTQHLMKRYSK
jgi:WD40 repeat protein